MTNLNRLADVDTRLYFITDSAMCAQAGRSVADTVTAAVRGGAGIIQVRDKTIDDDAFYELTRSVIRAVAQETAGSDRNIPIFLNDRVKVAKRLLDEGQNVHIHVGQDDQSVEAVRNVLGDKPLIGLSAATPQEFAAARASGCVDLVGIGPVFGTATKADAGDALGVEKLAELAAQAKIPSVAIGGINAKRAALLHGTGISGICVISAICLAENPCCAAKVLLSEFTGESL